MSLIPGRRRRSDTPTPTRSVRRRAGMDMDLFTPLSSLAATAAGAYLPANAVLAANTIKNAWRGYQAVKNASKMFKRPAKNAVTPGRATKKFRRASPFDNMSTGIYAGKFRKTKKKGPKLETYILSKGFHMTTEYFGSIADDHCIYVGHSTFQYPMTVTTICGALLRKLFTKAGVSIDSADSELPLSSYTNSVGWNIKYVEINPENASINEADYDTVNDVSLKSVVNGFTALYNAIDNAMSPGNQTRVPKELLLYTRDTTSSNRLIAKLDLTSEKIELYFQSTLIVQNRTKGAASASADYSSERVDNQPLTGYMYEFKNGDPRIRGPIGSPNPPTGGLNDHKLNRIQASGLTLVRGFELPNDFNEPVVPKKFINCMKSSKVLLQPGQMKKGVVTYKIKGYLITVLKAMRPHQRNDVDLFPFYHNVRGKMQLLGLEEIIRTSGDNKITCSYEREIKIGCVAKSNNRRVVTTVYSSAEANNLPA